MGEIKNPENSGVSDPSGDEQIDEEGEPSEAEPGDNKTPVTDETVDDDEVTNSVSTEVSVETETPDSEEEVGKGDEIFSSIPNALEPADQTVNEVEPDPTEEDPNHTKDLSSAVITYTDGCISNEKKIRKDADITFKVEAKEGRVLTKVAYKTGDATESSATEIEAQDGIYKISKDALMHAPSGSTEKVNDTSVTIIVTTNEVAYTLKADGTSNSAYKLYETKSVDGKTVADTTKEIAATTGTKEILYSEKGKDVSFVVSAQADAAGKKIRKVSVTAAGGDEKDLTSSAATDDDDKNPIYTFKPSELAGLAATENQAISICVEANEVATIAIDTAGVSVGAELTAVANASALYESADSFVQAGGSDTAETASEDQLVIFGVNKKANYTEIADEDVTATFTAEGEDTAEPCTVTAVAEDTTKNVKKHYKIDLSSITRSGTLAISVENELDDTATDVKKVDFTSVSENTVEVKTTGKVLTGTTEKTTGSSLEFSAAAKTGYEIYKVEAVYDKNYAAEDGATITDYVEDLFIGSGYIDKDGKLAASMGALESLTVTFGGTDAADVVADKGHAGKAWTTKSVKVNVYARMQEVTEDKTVQFDCGEWTYDYDVTLNDKVVATETDHTYTVKPGAEFFEFTVNAGAEPDVSAKDSAGNSILFGEPKQSEAGYVYQIAAGALSNEQHISINRKTFDIMVNYDGENIKAEVYRTSNAGEEKVNSLSSNPADYAYKFIIEPQNVNTKIDKVSFKVGDSGEAETVTARRDGSYMFYVDLTDDVTVNVETKDEYDLVVKENEKPVTPDKSDVYNVSHASAVTAELLKGQEHMPLFNAEVKDGSAVAATIASVADDVVTLAFDASEYNKVLTVELTLNDKDRTKRTFKVKTNALVEEVAIAGVKNGIVELPVDTKSSYKLTVKQKNASPDDLGVKVVPADDEKKADQAAITAANNAVAAEIDKDGNLIITAKPAMTGTENAAKVIVVDKSSMTPQQFETATVDNALKGGVVTVTTKEATIAGKAPTISLVTTTDQTIKVKLDVPKEVVNPVEGKIYYKVELTVPGDTELIFPEGTSDDAKAAIKKALEAAKKDWNDNLYQEKEKLDKNGGLLEIPVMNFKDVDVADSLKKGVLLEGFSVNATLLQTTGQKDVSDATKTIAGGEALLGNIATKNPYYEVKLGLKKGTTTLITGQNKDIVVATPNFNKLTSYSYVEVAFVDTATGELIGNGANAKYGDSYCGLDTRYDQLQNAVIVNAKDASYISNARDDYKNLGVKVTAYAEDSAYGAVATQKLTVVNGIEKINPAAPLEIYKGDKAASFTITTDLNNVSSNKKYAPKTKKLDYKIVAAKDGDELPTAIKANVTVKNGKVTINKNYVVAPRAEQNRFRVMVTALDYPDSKAIEYTKVITITGEPLEMGTIAVFDVSDGIDNAKLAVVNDGTLTAANKDEEYRVAVLAPNVGTNKRSYDLTSLDVMNSQLFTFKSSNTKSVAVDKDGDLTVLKAAKNVKLTATPKDGSKQDNKKITLNLQTVGQVAAIPYLEITRYPASTLDEDAAETVHAEGAPKDDIYYNGNSTNNYFELRIVKEGEKDEDGNVTSYVPYYLANYSISYKGAKQVKKTAYDDGDSITIVANAEKTTITLKDKTKRGDKGITYTLINDMFVSDKNAAAPKIATTTKLTHTEEADYCNVYYTVKGKKTDDFTDKYVVLTVDQTKKNPADIEYVFWGDERYLDRPIPIIRGEGFNIQVDTNYGVGTYNLVATVGSLVGGKFTPDYKDAKVVVKIAKAKAASLSATGNYTLSMKNQRGVYISYKSGNNWAKYTNYPDEEGNYAKNAIINGQENRFRDYFEAKYDGYGGMYIALKNDLQEVSPEGKPALSDIVGNEPEAKNNRIGYISINNGYKYIDVKLTITLKDCTTDKTKYKVTAAPVVAGEKSVSALTIMDGKSRAYVESMIVYSEEMDSSGKGLFKPEYDTAGNWYLTAQKATVKKNYPVTLYMVPFNAPNAYKEAVEAVEKVSGDETAKQAVYEKYCIKATVTVKASDKATTRNKVAVTNKGSNTWNVADTDYRPNTGWAKWTPVSFKSNLGLKEDRKITTAATVNGKEADYVSFKLSDDTYMRYEGEGDEKCIVLPTSYGMNIELDKAKLAAAITANAALGNKRNKNLDWGKTLSVKAVFSYGAENEDVPLKDELTFRIKLPAVGADDAAVQAALDDAFTDALQSNIETYTKQLSNDYDNDNDNYINYMVENYIRSEINKKIKGANVTVEIKNNVTENTQIASSWTVTVKAADAEKKVLYTHEFKLVELLDVSGIISAIANKLQKGAQGSNALVDKNGEVLLKVTSTTTGADYAEAVRKLLEEELGKRGSRNIALTAVKWFTDKNKESLAFTLRAKDMMKSPSDSSYSKFYEDTITYKLADKQKEELDRLIKGYLEKYKDEIEKVEGIQKAEYKEGVMENVFTVTVGPDAELENDVEKAFDAWRKANQEEIDGKRHSLAVALTNAFGEDWKEVESITAEVTVTVTNSKTAKRTILKNEGETIEEFANRYYDELLRQEDELREKCHEMLKEHGMDKVVFRQLKAVTGKALVTVNYSDGSGVSEMFKINVN